MIIRRRISSEFSEVALDALRGLIQFGRMPHLGRVRVVYPFDYASKWSYCCGVALSLLLINLRFFRKKGEVLSAVWITSIGVELDKNDAVKDMRGRGTFQVANTRVRIAPVHSHQLSMLGTTKWDISFLGYMTEVIFDIFERWDTERYFGDCTVYVVEDLTGWICVSIYCISAEGSYSIKSIKIWT